MKHETPPRSSSAGLAALGPHAGAVIVLMNMMYVRHLLATYGAFQGDLVAAIVLGEVAHHNLSTLLTRARTPIELSEAIVGAGAELRSAFQPTNTFSIAQATGIPRETIRRKVAWLVDRGWLVKDADGNLFVSSTADLDFAEFNAERLHDLLQCAKALDMLLPHRHQQTTNRQK